MAKATGKTAAKTPQNNKKTETDESVIDIKTRKPADSQKKAKPAKKGTKKETVTIKGTPDEIKGAAKILKTARKSGKLNTESTDEDITSAINSAGNEKDTFKVTPIHLDYSQAGQDPLKVKEFLGELDHYQRDLKVVKDRYNADVKECREVWDANKAPILASVESVYERAAEKGISRDALDYAQKINKPMTRAEYAKEQERRQMSLNLIGA